MIVTTPARADSPRQTMEALYTGAAQLDLAIASYAERRAPKEYREVLRSLDALSDLFDLSEVPAALRPFVGHEIAAQTLDLLAQSGPVETSALPGPDEIAVDTTYTYRIPGTAIRLWRVEDGTRRGEVLFDPQTVDTVIRDRGSSWYLTGQGRDRYFAVIALTGPLIPLRFAEAMPEEARVLLWGSPLWKVLSCLAITLFAGSALLIGHRTAQSLLDRHTKRRRLVAMLSPLVLAAVSLTLTSFFTFELRLSGNFSVLIHTVNTILLHAAAAWLLWLLIRTGFDRAADQFEDRRESLDANMLHLFGQIVAAFAAIFVLFLGAQALGLPILSVIAGFGIGGLAIALAIRPTFENLIGGVILYLDRPIRVGDFCTFGGLAGTVERIGVRSTQIRALDRTLINVPNAQFADLQLINWAECDMMMISETIGLRYETQEETLRFVLAEIRRMMHAHPRIDNDSVRVRFTSYGAYALDIEIRVYALTREWNDFYAIREDILLRVGKIVEDSGSGFAFPSQTMYLSSDGGLDEAAQSRSADETARWRNEYRFPFPRFSKTELDQIEGTLRYPPPGSHEYLGESKQDPSSAEALSVEPRQAEPEKEHVEDDRSQG
ncbi:MAG: mechanosensitive ion channel family protein [Pseudomonadota bacterium]